MGQLISSIPTAISVWAALSFVVNVLLLIKGPQAWVDTAKKNPTAALVVNILFRALGVDLVSVITHFRDYLNARAAQAQISAQTAPTDTSSADIPITTELPEEEKKS